MQMCWGFLCLFCLFAFLTDEKTKIAGSPAQYDIQHQMQILTLINFI